ncbi:GGDEF domain-containing protein [Sphingomonas crocodyli]|uniref:diguanylate cyclase n=1 Tax=Sphingomonas crocodyli TaxID=1979270 RepID=A0A437M8K9_9SPHN|nr:GGDEF domain-containing protein [Sphingomonas crocodyli]RVT93906.1 GGDEF domain-containing protein [Sphingomonas crocodyli]
MFQGKPPVAEKSAAYPGERPVDLFERIGGFLRANKLDPTPINYDLAHQFFCSDDPNLVAAIDGAIRRDGLLRPEVAAEISQAASNQISSELLDQLLGRAHKNMTMAAGLVTQSTADVKAYGSALASGAGTMTKGGVPAQTALGLLVELTRTMIGKTQDAEAQLRSMGEQMASLRDDLAEAQATAESDPLTGLANRRAFQAKLLEAIEQAEAEGYPLSVAFCDIDHFKKINDTHGHDTGDRILKMFAEALSDGVGEDTLVGRFGGEEFLVLFDGIMARRAAMRVDEVRDELGNRSLVNRTTGEPMDVVTFSAGVAQLQPGEDSDALLKRADEALYKAKNAGRNRVLIAGDD